MLLLFLVVEGLGIEHDSFAFDAVYHKAANTTMLSPHLGGGGGGGGGGGCCCCCCCCFFFFVNAVYIVKSWAGLVFLVHGPKPI